MSAWAGLHYFASRHGFAAPGVDAVESDGLLTWPEGNAWLTQRMAAPLGSRLHTGQVVLRITNLRHHVEVDAFNTATQALERWQARRAIVALPIFVAARVVANAPDFCAALRDRPGAPPSWDNVLYDSGASVDPSDGVKGGGLGYVDAMHQSLRPVSTATVLTHYCALGDDIQGGPSAGRALLMEKPWAAWRDEIMAELSAAHSDWAGYSVFEEAFTLGHLAGV